MLEDKYENDGTTNKQKHKFIAHLMQVGDEPSSYRQSKKNRVSQPLLQSSAADYPFGEDSILMSS